MIPDNIQVSNNQHAKSSTAKHSTQKSEQSSVPSRTCAGMVIAEMLAQVDKTSRTTLAAQQEDDKNAILEQTIMNALSQAGDDPSAITDMLAQLKANDKTLPVNVQNWISSNYHKIKKVIDKYAPEIDKYEKKIEKLKKQDKKLEHDVSEQGGQGYALEQNEDTIKSDQKKMDKQKGYMQDLVSGDAKRAANTGKTDGEYCTETIKLLGATQKDVSQEESSSESTIGNMVSGLAINSPARG